MKRRIVAITMAFVIIFSSVAVLAAEPNETEGMINPFAGWHDILPITRDVVLTEEARELALEDFDYFVEKYLAVAPTQNIIGRRFGISAEEYFAIYRDFIVVGLPMPSLLSFIDAELWLEPRDNGDARALAADFLTTLFITISSELGVLGHLSFQPREFTWQFMQAGAYIMSLLDDAEELTDEAMEELLGELAVMGLTLEEAETMADAVIRFWQQHVEIYNKPSVLWFYDVDPAEFVLDETAITSMGEYDEYNIYTSILDEDNIAYLRIASFMGNMEFDNETLLPFFDEIQNFEHLIIDIRGNGGGFAGYFPLLIVEQLISEPLNFTDYEFFISSERTAEYYVNPHGMTGGILQEVLPIADFMAERDLPYFNQDDLSLLDYVIIRNVFMYPSENSVGFNGEIWLLVDEYSASASELAAILSIATGFATVVGEPTAGVTGVLYTFAALPNTGLLIRIDLGYTIDNYGLSIEEFGVIPQILNVPGLDALQTVLSIIAPELVDVDKADETLFIIVDDTMYLSLRMVVESFGFAVEWDSYNYAALVLLNGEVVATVSVAENGVILADGRVFVSAEVLDQLFDD